MRRKKKSKKKEQVHPSLSATEEALVTPLLQESGDCDPGEIAARIQD